MTSFVEVVEPIVYISDHVRNFSGAAMEQFSRSMSSSPCVTEDAELEAACRNGPEALRLKMVAIVAVLVAGVAGVALPLLGRKRRYLRTDSTMFTLAKAFAAGVILATGFVHMLNDGQEALSSPCLPESPWSQFPFPGFIAMISALLTFVLDFVATQFYERKHQQHLLASSSAPSASSPLLASRDSIPIVIAEQQQNSHERNSKEENMHIVGVRAHAAEHNHDMDSHGHEHGHHLHSHEGGEGAFEHVRHVVLSQILEMGIVSHSVIIGLSLGVSRSPCTIRPLIGALSFHQFFEGLALGGCISQAQLERFASGLMAGFFAGTTPAGIAAGTAAASMYDPNSPRALAVEGVLDCVSAGILIYMALVDLIAADFMNKRMSCDVRVQVGSYLALFLGAAAMSVLAIWA